MKHAKTHLLLLWICLYSNVSFSSDLHDIVFLKDYQPKSNKKKYYIADFPSFDLRYLDHLEYSLDLQKIPIWKEALPLIEYYENYKLRYGSLIEQGYEVPAYIQYINEVIGYGVFASKKIVKGQMIGEYTGIVLSANQLPDPFDHEANKYIMKLGLPYADPCLNFYIDAKSAGNITRFINHSDTPNIATIAVFNGKTWHVLYVAAQDIPVDAQLLVDYGKNYWINRPKPVHL